MLVGFLALPYLRTAHAQAAATTLPGLNVGGQDTALPAVAVPEPAAGAGGEANLHLPNLNDAKFFNGAIGGHTLLTYGMIFCVLGVIFGLVIYVRLKNMEVHPSMLEVSELIYATCKTYLLQQGKFLLMLWAFIALVILAYFGYLNPIEGLSHGVTLPMILLFSLLGIRASYGVAWFGIRINTVANSPHRLLRAQGQPVSLLDIPLQSGMSVGLLLVSVELFFMICILVFLPGDLAGPCFIGFAIGESLGAAALRISGGIFTKIADIGSDLMKIVFKLPEDDPKPRRHRRLHRRQRRRLGRPDGRRLRNLRRDRRGADRLPPAGGPVPAGPGATAHLDVRHARDDRHRRGVAYFVNEVIGKAKFGK